MLLFFGFLDRLVLPLYVVGLGAVVELIRDVAARWGGPRVGFAAAATALISVILADFESRKNWDTIALQHRDHARLADQLNERLSPSARIAAPLGFTYGVHLDRPVYSLRIAVNRARDPAAAEEVIDRYNVDTVFVTSADTKLLSYFRERYGPGDVVGPARVWHVRRSPRPPSG
jgi:hypothetical protein